MDKEDPPYIPRKVKFVPRRQPKRSLIKDTIPEKEVADDPAEAAETQNLIRRFNEKFQRKEPKSEKTATPVQVAFGHEATSPNSIATFGVPASGTSSSRISVSELKDHEKQELDSLSSMVDSDRIIADDAGALAKSKKKEYKEPWDYHSNYPTTLPLRKPYSGDPALLDKAEFGEGSENKEYGENIINSALELGLLEGSLESKHLLSIEEKSMSKSRKKTEMFFVQLPSTLPFVKRSASAKGKEKMGASKIEGNLGDLPGGYMGKMLVYKSGAVKLKLGDTLHDVSPGVECKFAQDAVAINMEEKDFCVLGELSKKMIVTPDIDSMLDSVIIID